jgi:hypothetical protein
MAEIVDLLEAARPSQGLPTPNVDAAWQSFDALHLTPVRHRRSTVAIGSIVTLVAAVALIVAFLPSTSPPPASAASRFLNAAAAHAKTTKSAISYAQLAKFRYIETQLRYSDGGLRKNWRSVDGTQQGLSELFSARDGVLTLRAVGFYDPCDARLDPNEECWGPAAFPHAPSAPLPFVEYLERHEAFPMSEFTTTKTNPLKWPPYFESANLLGVLTEDYLTPSQQSAIYAILAKNKQMFFVPHIEDAIHRSGVGIEYRGHGISFIYIFNPSTYALLGFQYRGVAVPSTGSRSIENWAYVGLRGTNTVPTICTFECSHQ